jgi:hypothetical protein
MCLIYCVLDKSQTGLAKTGRKSSAFEREYNGNSWKKVFSFRVGQNIRGSESGITGLIFNRFQYFSRVTG